MSTTKKVAVYSSLLMDFHGTYIIEGYIHRKGKAVMPHSQQIHYLGSLLKKAKDKIWMVNKTKNIHNAQKLGELLVRLLYFVQF